MCLISLAFVFFKAFIFWSTAHTEGNFILFEFTFLRLSHGVLRMFYQCRRQWIKAIIDFTPSDETIRLFRRLSRSSKLANTVVFHHFAGNSGRGTLGFRFSPGCRLGLLLLCIRDLAQLNFHAFLAVFSSAHSHTPKSFSLLNALLRIRPNWKLALQQLLLIFVCRLFFFHELQQCVSRKLTETLSNFKAFKLNQYPARTPHADMR